MSDWQESTFAPTDEVAQRTNTDAAPQLTNDSGEEQRPQALETAANPTAETDALAMESSPAEASNGVAGTETERWRARAGRKGAHRIHQLIQEGKLYEQEHGLKRGRQRLRQLIELGKVYEQEHGLRPAAQTKNTQRLSRMGREELLGTLLQCLLRIAKPSFRTELEQLVAALQKEEGHAA